MRRIIAAFLPLAAFAAACGGAAGASPPTPEALPSAAEAAPAASGDAAANGVILAQSQILHDGFRIEVVRTLRAGAPPAPSARRLTLSLENLSKPSGGLSSRATVNLGTDFRNFIVLPTDDGPITLHLHRDGTLREAPDDGGFT